MQKRIALIAMCAALLVAVSAASAQTELEGQTSGGAYYKITVPDGWAPANGLVIWNHGFSLSPIGPVTDQGPLLAAQLAQGYAVAASSYSLTGWALFETTQDLQEMVQDFVAEFGTPDQVLIYGASLGGIVTAQAIEVGGLGNVVGAMPICGAVAGSRAWDGAVDLRLLYDYICGDVPGAAIPGGAFGLPFPPDPAFDEVALATAVNACTGLLTPPELQTPEQQANLGQLLALTGLPPEFIITDMGFATFGMADLVYDPRKLAGSLGVDNSKVDYGDAAVNAGIARVTADPAMRLKLRDNYTPTGNVGDTKIVSLHTDKDGLVILEHESEYASVVPAKNLTIGVVVEDTPSHCDFNPAELLSGWESLRAWVAGAPQPSAAELQGTCEAIVAGGLAPGPCRIADNFDIPDLDGRVRQRDICMVDDGSLCLQGGRFRVSVNWTDFEGNSGSGIALPQTSDTGAFWFFNEDNLELVVKVLDGRTINSNFWVFFGSLSNVEFEVTVEDTDTGAQKVYRNNSGTFASVGDTSAF